MPRRKRKEYAVDLDAGGRAYAERGDVLLLGEDWTPEHLLLAALARCSVISLGHHARRDGCEAEATARATGAVYERADGSWGFVEIACEVEATVRPALDEAALGDLVERAERGCFVGASLDPRPAYSWRINGDDRRVTGGPARDVSTTTTESGSGTREDS